MRLSRPTASSTGLPRTRFATTRIFGATSRCHELVLRACIASLLLPLAEWPWKVRVGGELAELVADHVLGDEDRDELAAVVHRERVADESGMIVERRDQVLIDALLLFGSFAAVVDLLVRCLSTNGPFLS